MKLSNTFTTMRLVFAPIFFLLYNIPLWTHSELLCKISSFIMLPLLAIFELTDYFDGYFARKNGEVSDFGKLFDPFADVILNLTVFLCATRSVSPKISTYMPLVIFVFILYREFSMNFIRMIAVSKGVAIAARKGGKIKTVFYITSGFFALLIESLLRLNIDLPYLMQFKVVAVILFSICLLLSYISFIDYIKTFCKILK
ncbi:MAG: CDP-diacylglycerol--glycerol-3-phosphate 3-phosphatidyltransferase [Treponema sp.]|nr:CDP-diacylglycerol--glycerol-3-phosphate 3-phosphatidyltransferase [Treponema sp.]